MTATDKIRALMADGRTRTSREVARAVGGTVPDASHALRRRESSGLLLCFPAPPSRHGRRGHLWRINPNCPAVIAAGK